MGKCEIKIEKNATQYNVTVSGTIDEDMDFGNYSLSGATQVDLQLGGVKSINSCGIREWIKWLGSAGNAKILFYECPKIIVDQINMVQGFLPASGKVMSFYVPYYNDDVGSEKNVLFSFGKEYTDSSLAPPAEIKDPDGNLMEMDVVEAKYFKFIKK